MAGDLTFAVADHSFFRIPGGRLLRTYHGLVLLLPCSPMLKILLGLVCWFPKLPYLTGANEGIKFLVGVTIYTMEAITFH